MIKTIALLLLISLTLTQTYDVNSAQNLLNELDASAKEELADIDAQWLANSQLLMENVASWEDSQATQNTECTARSDDVAQVLSEDQDNKDYLQYLSDKIAANTELYNGIYSSRCEANRRHIGSMGQNKVMLGLIKYLKTAIENSENMSFVIYLQKIYKAQKKEYTANIYAFIQFYKTSDIKSLLQMKARLTNKKDYEVNSDTSVSARTDEQIGTGHIDDGRQNIQVGSYSSSQGSASAKESLLALLDQFQAQVEANLATASQDEIDAGIAAAEFRANLESEVQQLDREVYTVVEKISYFDSRLVQVNNALRVCQSELERVNTALDQARSEYDLKLQQYNALRAAKVEEVEVFEYVLGLYSDQVNVDTSYEARELDQLDLLSQ